MCAIVDANVRDEVFKGHEPDATDAGAKFFEWIKSGKGQIVVGGTKLLDELFGTASRRQRELFASLRRSGGVKEFSKEAIDKRAAELRRENMCQSDDHHIIALAQVSRARLLYSNDEALRQDFGDNSLLRKPSGRIYSTKLSKTFTDAYRGLLENRELCKRT